MANVTKNQKTEQNQKVGQAVSNTEVFFKKYGNLLTYIVIGIVVVAAIIVAVLHFYVNPKKTEAVDQTFVAEQYFRAGNFETALNGDGNALGFSQIITEYGRLSTSAVYLYAGICELQLNKAEEAIAYLKKYNGKDPILYARSLCCIGDGYVMLDKYSEALSYYLKAADHADNIFSAAYLLKAGIICEEMGHNEEALKHYQVIKDKYPQTFEGYEIDKYISRIKVEK